MSGRAADIAVASGGTKVYVATANGGVWRSDDTGRTWRSLMDAWDLNPTQLASDSLACGAIALDPTNDQRVYVGTGEGNTGIYFGVGPVVTSDGGLNWSTEPASPASVTAGWPLAGSAFFALAVDPGNVQRVVAATRTGLYRREPASGGGYHWDKKAIGTAPGGGQYAIHSVVAARTGTTTTFYAAHFRGPVYSSTDGATWAVVGTGFPASTNVGRIGLAVRPTDPSVVYALVGDLAGAALGVWRLDTAANNWLQVAGHPTALFGTVGYYQGYWDLAIAVDPNDAARIYLGGSTVFGANNWCAALYRCSVASSGSGGSLSYSMTPTMIGNSVHADVHRIVFAPGDSNKLWVACDGGVFYSTNPAATAASFTARNTGLQTMTMNDLAQHPSEDAVLFGGTQDNGVARFTGEEAWYHSWDGDAGYCVVNWNDPYKVLTQYVNNYVYRSTNGGVLGSFTNAIVPTATGEASLFYAPLVTTPPNPAAPADAEIVAFGSVRPWISTNFGTTWQSIPNNTLAGDSLTGRIRSLAFASATRLFAGTRADQAGQGNGRVYRFDRSGTTWTSTRIDNVSGGALGVVAPVTAIAVDPADATGASIYVTLGGTGDYRHVWHFNGTSWQQRSGAPGSTTRLLDVQANAVVVDPQAATNVYVGTDIGVWRSVDSGATWAEFSAGLPDAAVLDLVLHDPRRLLRASTHGRGVFEWKLGATPPAVELYVRDTQLDQGRFSTTNWLADPTKQGELVRHWAGPDIRLDTPDQAGTYQFPITPGTTIDFFEFTDALNDDFQNVATHATSTIVTRVYVQVHNRGITPASSVRVMLLLANASAGLPPLPAGYTTNVQNGTPISTTTWRTVGTVILNDVRVGFPKIAAFELPSNLLPPPASLAGNQHHCVLALLHHASDQFTSTTTVTDTLSLTDRKAAHKNLKVVAFTGTVPPVPPVAVPVDIHHSDPEQGEAVVSLRIERRGYPGRIRVFLPTLRTRGELGKLVDGGVIDDDVTDLRRWAAAQRRLLARTRAEHSFDAAWTAEREAAILKAVEARTAIVVRDREAAVIRGIVTRRGDRATLIVMIDAPARLRTGSHRIGIAQSLGRDDRWSGGLEIRVDVIPAARTRRGA